MASICRFSVIEKDGSLTSFLIDSDYLTLMSMIIYCTVYVLNMIFAVMLDISLKDSKERHTGKTPITHVSVYF